jgi:two-component system, OmpR family, sensor kinase
VTPSGSLRGRLAWALGAGITLLWLAATLVTAAMLNREIDEVFDSAMQEAAQRILPLAVVDIVNREDGVTTQHIVTLRPHEEQLTYVVRDAAGAILLRSHNAQSVNFPPFVRVGFAETATHRLYYETALDGSITIAVAESLAHRATVARESLFTLALPLLVLVPLSLLGVWAVVQLTLRPVERLGAQIAGRGGGDLTPITGLSLPQEIAPIAGAVNQLLARLRRTLEAERSFTSNAAHELRTPVAAALAQTQRLIAETRGAETQARARQVEASLQRLARLSEKMLQLARAEGSAVRTQESHDLKPVLRLVVDELARADGAPARIAVTLPEGPALAAVSQDAFAILVRNLVENALKHAPAGSPVEVTLTSAGDLTVVNGGPAIAPDVLQQLTEPLTRGPTAAEGTGLGLTIARTIATAAGGTLTLHSPAPGRPDGFAAVFTIGWV